ncbi:MAG: phenylalanine--tRNA ligase subunit alpha [Terriglobia bacterium]
MKEGSVSRWRSEDKYLGRKKAPNASDERFQALDGSASRGGKHLNEPWRGGSSRARQSCQLSAQSLRWQLAAEAVDITLSLSSGPCGQFAPIDPGSYRIEDISLSPWGIRLEDGPEIETTFHNFEGLNIPEQHPARDPQDTFYIMENLVLRTHTSPVQVRVMKSQKPPLRIICPGKVYRRDNPDATHSPAFQQIEGLAVDEGLSFRDFKGTLEYFLKSFFSPKTVVRFRPSYFAFTEPSAEVDISCSFCGGTGCRICKMSGWIEVLGAGMVDPAVFEAVGYDAEKYTGFAFGLGIERFAMLKYSISNIQYFYEGDLRFLEQF